jgi:quinohemoprotein ethanol dehydrogenase
MRHIRGLSTTTILIMVAVLAAAAWLLYSRDEGAGPPTEPPAPATADPVAAEPSPDPGLKPVDEARVAGIEANEPGAWLSYGRTYEEQRFSPLDEVNRETVSDLGIAFYKDLDTFHPVEATPLMADGVLYFTTPFNHTYAVDARTGEELWHYDPEVPGATAREACCGVISRGLALYGKNAYIATLDGRLIALDRATGTPVWEVDTVIDRSREYTITGAPRAAAGKIFIGNGGAEYGVRGYVTAYDAETGEEVWRFFTVPGNPAEPFEHPEMELAAETWKGGAWWEIGGGGTVWNSIVYDPDFNTVYLGVGNGSPWTRAIRSPGGGDNLFLASIVAVDADTGQMKWYYQTTPGDNWDYTAVQDMMLADLTVDGVERKVLMQAPKNGFFYVIDRADGTLLRAHPYATTTWATHVDMETGRPVENPDTAYADNPQWILPGPSGGHNWQAMAWDAGRGLMYFTSHDLYFLYAMPEEFQKTGTYKRRVGAWNTAVEMGRRNQMMEAMGDTPNNQGYLNAFDPLTGEKAWMVEMDFPWNGGVLATAGNLVFQGDQAGNFTAYDSDTGEVVWQRPMYTSIIAPPMTYELDGQQHVAILTGFGGSTGSAGERYGAIARLVVFKLGADTELPVPPERDLTIPEQPPMTASADDLDRGDVLYHDICTFCHGQAVRSGGGIPDLRRMSQESHDTFLAIVLGGSKQANGMAGFADLLTAEDAERIRQYIIHRANLDRELDREEAMAAEAEEAASG